MSELSLEERKVAAEIALLEAQAEHERTDVDIATLDYNSKLADYNDRQLKFEHNARDHEWNANQDAEKGVYYFNTGVSGTSVACLRAYITTHCRIYADAPQDHPLTLVLNRWWGLSIRRARRRGLHRTGQRRWLPRDHRRCWCRRIHGRHAAAIRHRARRRTQLIPAPARGQHWRERQGIRHQGHRRTQQEADTPDLRHLRTTRTSGHRRRRSMDRRTDLQLDRTQ